MLEIVGDPMFWLGTLVLSSLLQQLFYLASRLLSVTTESYDLWASVYLGYMLLGHILGGSMKQTIKITGDFDSLIHFNVSVLVLNIYPKHSFVGALNVGKQHIPIS